MCEALGLPRTTHATAAELKKMLGARYDSMFSFAFVRNPWERFVSLYIYARMQESFHHSVKNAYRSRYGKHPDYEILKNSSIRDTAQLLVDGRLCFQWLPQHQWVCDENGSLMVNFIGQLETVQDDWARLASQISVTTSLPWKNVSNVEKIAYQDLIDAKTKAIVDEYYKKDIELFGFKF
jgi:chondroitin 4-sulfotransferase 11